MTPYINWGVAVHPGLPAWALEITTREGDLGVGRQGITISPDCRSTRRGHTQGRKGRIDVESFLSSRPLPAFRIRGIVHASLPIDNFDELIYRRSCMGLKRGNPSLGKPFAVRTHWMTSMPRRSAHGVKHVQGAILDASEPPY